MSRPLDFIVFGVPRSGTKALVRALNLHPQVYCAMERFHFRADHARLSFPESFLDRNGVRRQDDVAKIDRIAKSLEAKEEVRFAGNKLPRYYFALDRINREVPRLRNIWIYRSPYGFMPSWNRREAERHRGHWPAGQIGLFGLLELLVCIENSLNLGTEVFVFPYMRGLGDCPDVILQALEFLGADPAQYDRRSFEKKQDLQGSKRGGRRAAGSHSPALRDFEQDLLEVLHIEDLDALLEQDRGLLLSEVSAQLSDYLARITPHLPRVIDRAFSACDNRAVPSFGREYFKRNRRELKGLLKRAQGSEALASLQRFGAYERLKSLYVQRGR